MLYYIQHLELFPSFRYTTKRNIIYDVSHAPLRQEKFNKFS
ncbi:hypothetical protein K011_2452 [Acinetobacter baumannii 25569_5]|nr:hypothetical protein K011_2452 [Acinetobacter baumannii 25569_5]